MHVDTGVNIRHIWGLSVALEA